MAAVRSFRPKAKYANLLAHHAIRSSATVVYRNDKITDFSQRRRGRGAAKAQPKGYHHGGTETPRKSKSKARPESTEVAEATERRAGAMGASAQESEGALIDNRLVQTLYSYAFGCAPKNSLVFLQVLRTCFTEKRILCSPRSLRLCEKLVFFSVRRYPKFRRSLMRGMLGWGAAIQVLGEFAQPA